MQNMKKVIVTGGAGFIGSHLVERLIQEEFFVVVLDNFSTGRKKNLSHLGDPKNLSVIEIDVADYDKIAPHFKDVEWVFHLAALAYVVPSIDRPLDYYHSNFTATTSVLEASRQAGVKKFIYAASSSCYGLTKTYPTPETAAVAPEYPYALTKFLGEQCLLHWGQVYKLPVISLRLFNVFGPRARTAGTYGAVFGVFLAQKRNGKPFTIVGDGTQKRDFIFVTDVIEAFLKAACSNVQHEIFNIGSGKPTSVNRIAELLNGEKVFVPKRPGEPEITHADISKVRKELNWEPVVTIEKGVNILLGHMDDFKDSPVWTPETIQEATKNWFALLERS